MKSNLDVYIKKERIKNCLTVDIEGFIESNIESFKIDTKYLNKKKENYEIERNVNYILKLFDEQNIKATFFCLGRIAKDLPHVVKLIANEGHEIACHSFEHLRIFNIKREYFKNKIFFAKKELEDISGKQVIGFRAPDFSITKDSLWALDILKEAGFIYDSSIYPIGMHDVYGIDSANRFIHYLPNGLIELPLSTFKFMGQTIPFGGGGYLRLYPIKLTMFLIRKINNKGHPCIVYFHPYEIGPIIPEIKELSYYRKFRHYHNCNKGTERILTLLKNFDFCPAFQLIKNYL